MSVCITTDGTTPTISAKYIRFCLTLLYNNGDFTHARGVDYRSARTPPGVALTSINVDDFLGKRWNWAKPVRISPPDVDDKDACVFPEKVKDPATGEERYLVIHRINPYIDYALIPTLEFDGNTWVEENQWIGPRRGSWDSVKVGLASPPIKTEKGGSCCIMAWTSHRCTGWEPPS